MQWHALPAGVQRSCMWMFYLQSTVCVPKRTNLVALSGGVDFAKLVGCIAAAAAVWQDFERLLEDVNRTIYKAIKVYVDQVGPLTLGLQQQEGAHLAAELPPPPLLVSMRCCCTARSKPGYAQQKGSTAICQQVATAHVCRQWQQRLCLLGPRQGLLASNAHT